MGGTETKAQAAHADAEEVGQRERESQWFAEFGWQQQAQGVAAAAGTGCSSSGNRSNWPLAMGNWELAGKHNQSNLTPRELFKPKMAKRRACAATRHQGAPPATFLPRQRVVHPSTTPLDATRCDFAMA